MRTGREATKNAAGDTGVRSNADDISSSSSVSEVCPLGKAAAGKKRAKRG